MRSRSGKRRPRRSSRTAWARSGRTTQRNRKFAAGRRGRRQDDVGGGDGGEFLEKGARTVAETGAALPLLQRLPQHIGEKGHQDMRQHAILALMPDGTDRQIGLMDAKGRFRLGKLDIGSP